MVRVGAGVGGGGRVGWEPELTPHNDCLAGMVSPISQKRREVETVRGKGAAKVKMGKEKSHIW